MDLKTIERFYGSQSELRGSMDHKTNRLDERYSIDYAVISQVLSNHSAKFEYPMDHTSASLQPKVYLFQCANSRGIGIRPFIKLFLQCKTPAILTPILSNATNKRHVTPYPPQCPVQYFIPATQRTQSPSQRTYHSQPPNNYVICDANQPCSRSLRS